MLGSGCVVSRTVPSSFRSRSAVPPQPPPDPPAIVPAGGVVVGPVERAAEFGPRIFALEANPAPDLQRNAPRQVDVVRNKHGKGATEDAALDPDEEPLVAAADAVVRENPDHAPAADDPRLARATPEGDADRDAGVDALRGTGHALTASRRSSASSAPLSPPRRGSSPASPRSPCRQ